MAVLLSNAFSIQMLKNQGEGIIRYKEIDPLELKKIKFKSMIGNENLAKILSNELQMNIEYNKGTILIGDEDTLYVVSIVGGKLPEDKDFLPLGYSIKITKIVVL